MKTPTTRRRVASRGIGASLLTGAAIFVLSGCTLITTLAGGGSGGGSGPQEDVDVIPTGLESSIQAFYEQDLDWDACGNGRECATAEAPMNWADGTSEKIELAMVKVPAASGNSLGTIFTNPGGPGASGVSFVRDSAEYVFTPELMENFDIVGWDPRGVGESSAVDCRDDAGMDEWFYGVNENLDAETATDEQIIAEVTANSKEFADDCLENTGALLEFVDTKSTVKDLDMMRALVGDPKVNYFGFSYGTDIGAQYIDMFPETVGRVVLDGATDPTLSTFEVVLAQQGAFGEATRTYLEDCLTTTSCPFTGTVDDAIAKINTLMAEADETLPVNADGRKLTSGVIDTAISSALYNDQSWPYLSDAFASYETAGDPAGFFLLSDSYYGREPDGTYADNMFEAFTAINCLDYPVETDPAKIADFNRQIAESTPIGIPGPEALGDTTCQQWAFPSTNELAPVTGAGADPVLVIGTTGDPATPYAWAEAVTEQLESAVLVTFEGEGHLAYTQGDSCITGAVDAYFIDGTVPAEGLVC